MIEQTSYWDVWSEGEQPHATQIGNYTLAPSRTLYFRKQNLSFHDSVAYRLTAFYRFGIVIYLQGKEIVRDNLPSGPIDNTTYAQGGYSTYITKSFIRQTPDFRNADSIDLLVELHWMKDDVENGKTLQVLFDMRLNELGNSPDSSCYFLFHNILGDEAADLNTRSFMSYTHSPATYTLSLSSTTTVNSFCFYASSYQWYQPQSFDLFLLVSQSSPSLSKELTYSNSSSDNQIKVKMVSELYPEWNGMAWTCFKTVNDELPASAMEIVMTSSHLPIHLYEVAVGICPKTHYPPLEYDNTNQYFAGVDVIELYPLHNIYSNCYSITPLPEGLRLINTTCQINGIYSGSESNLVLSISATTPVQTTTTIHLQIIQCTDLHIQVVRKYGETDVFFEWVYFENVETEELFFSIPSQSSQQPSTQMVYNICLQPGVIQIKLGNDKGITWSTNSYLHINLVTRTGLLPLLTTRYDEEIVGYEGEQLFSLVFPVLPESLWHYHFNTIPEGWTDRKFTPTAWNTSCCGYFPSSTTQFQFYYMSFELMSVSDITGIRLHLYMEYCYMIYLNGLLVDARGVSLELTPQTYCYSEHVDTFTSLTLASERYLQEGTNSLIVALVINQQTGGVSTFDGFIQLIYSEQYSRLDDVSILSIPTSPNSTRTQQAVPNAENIFDLNSQTSVTVTKCEQNRISFMLSEEHSHRLETFNEIIFFNSIKESGIPDLGGFVLEGRNSNLDEWTLITSVSDLYWMSYGQSKRIFIHPPISFRYYQFVNLTSESYPNSCSWTLTAITFLLFKPDLSLPLEYPSSQVPALSLVYLYPFSPYYTNYEAQGLPSKFQIDPIFGIVYGIATEETHLNFQITAQNSMNVIVSHSFSFWLHSCLFPDSIPIELHVSSYSSAFTLTASVVHEGTTIVSDTFTITNQNQYYRQYCLSNHQFYIFFLQATDTVSGNDKVWLTIYPFTLPLFPAFLDSQGHYDAAVDLSVRIGELSQWSYAVEWSSLEWMNDSFDDSCWHTTVLTKPFIHDNIIYFRNKLTITDNDVLLHLYLAYEGGVAIFLNGTLVSLLNLLSPYQNTSIAIEHHNFDQQEEITINLVQAGVYPGEHTLAIAYHCYPEQASASARIVVQAFVIKEPTPLYRTSLMYKVESNLETQDTHSSNYTSSVGVLTEFNTIVVHNDYDVYLQLQPIDMLPIKPRGFRFHITPETQLEVTLEGFREGGWEIVVQKVMTSAVDMEISADRLLIGYSYFRLKFLSAYSIPVFYISNFVFTFPSQPGLRCDAYQGYPAAWDQSISALPCKEGYSGYQYRQCKERVFGPVINDYCLLNEPKDLEYSEIAGEYLVNVDLIWLRPVQYSGVIDYFTIEPTLPAGLTFNQTTGVLRGVVTKKIPRTDFVITAHNQVGITSFAFTLITQNAYCNADHSWPVRIVQNASHILSCNEENGKKQIGLRYRRCWIRDGKGVWEEEVRYCLPQSTVALGIVMLVVLLSLCYSECSRCLKFFKKRRFSVTQ